MCKIMEELCDQRAMEIAYNLLTLGTVSNEDIAKATELPIEKIEELAEELKSVNA